jgi:rhodanese-related sulfurtransferase
MLSWFRKRPGSGGADADKKSFPDPMPGWKPSADADEEEEAGHPLEITCQEVERILEESTNKRVCFVDVRENWEHQNRRLENSHHVPLGTVSQRLDELADLAMQSDLMVVYCEHGMRSLDAAERMRRGGVDQARSLAGGMSAWASAIGKRMESGPVKPSAS